MLKKLNIGIVGATGLVGNTLIQLLIHEGVLPSRIHCLSRKENISLNIAAHSFTTKPLEFDQCDLYFFCTSGEISQTYIPTIKQSLVIDLSSAFRMEKNIPLILPEVNGHLLHSENTLIASPNCIVNIIGFTLHLLHQKYFLTRIIGSTYQAISGGGRNLLKQFEQELLESHHTKAPLARNVLCHESDITDHLQNEEENKIQNELSKILNLDASSFFFSCFRVPVFRSHGVSLNLTFEKKPEIQEIKKELKKYPSIQIIESAPYANPYQASNQNETFISRIRYDQSCKNTISLWIVGDQLLKGAALNALQIAKCYYGEKTCLSLCH